MGKVIKNNDSDESDDDDEYVQKLLKETELKNKDKDSSRSNSRNIVKLHEKFTKENQLSKSQNNLLEAVIQ